MKLPNDAWDEMVGTEIDRATDELLLGRTAASEPTDETARVAAVVAALTSPASSAELEREPEAIAAAVRLSGIDAEWQKLSALRRSPLRSIRRTLIAPLVASVVLGTAGQAMAGG